MVVAGGEHRHHRHHSRHHHSRHHGETPEQRAQRRAEALALGASANSPMGTSWPTARAPPGD